MTVPRVGRILAGAVMISALSVFAAACGSSNSADSGTTQSGSTGAGGSAGAAAGGQVQVVASTDVWGDIVGQIGGDHVKVTSFITDPDADPHSYEANAQNQLVLSKATLVVENGGGYDDFVDTMLKSAKNDKATVLNAVTISGKQADAGGELNEHVWYDFPTVQKVAAQIESALSKADPANAADYQANAATFDKALQGLEAQEADIAAKHKGDGVAITEPVPVYLLDASGLVNKTPAEFSESVENGTDVSVQVLQQTLDLFTKKEIKALVYNEQTSDPQTEKVLDAAKTNGIAVVPVTETLPSGKDYLSWMTGNVTAVAAALG